MVDLQTTVQGIYAAFGRGDVPAILDALDDTVAWEAWADNGAAKAGVPWMLPRQGKAGAAEFFGLLASTLEVLDFRVLAIMPGESQVAVEFVIEAEVTATGRRYRDEEMHLWTFNDAGKVVRLRHYLDTAKHMWAAGVADRYRGV